MAGSLLVVRPAAAAAEFLAAVMASVTAPVAGNTSGQCAGRVVRAGRRPHTAAVSSDDVHLPISSNNNSMNNCIDSVIVSDTGPPPAYGHQSSAHSNPSPSLCIKKMTLERRPLCGHAIDERHSERAVQHRWLLSVFFLSIMLSALPNSCSSAASIHHHQSTAAAVIVPSARSRTSSGRHRPSHSPSTLLSSSTSIQSECPWMQWEPKSNANDISSVDQADVAGTRAYMAPVVFEGKARSRSDGAVYRVTFDVVTVYKGEVALTGSQVRLEFKSGVAAPNTQSSASHSKSLRSLSRNSATTQSRTLSAGRRDANSDGASSSQRRRQQGQQHHHRHRHHNTRQCLVTAEIRTGRRYLIFAAHWGPNNFTAFGSPLLHTKKSLKDVRSTLCPRCGESFWL